MKYWLVLDVETCPMDKELEGVEPKNMLVYDIGWAIIDFFGNIHKEQSFVNADVFLGEKPLMKSAYYSNKIPNYWEDIKNGDKTLTNMYHIRKAFLDDVKQYDIEDFYAYNMKFDFGALNRTQNWLTKSKYKYFFPYGANILDIMKLAQEVVATDEEYKKFCYDNGYVTSTNRPQLKAETVYRFIKKDTTFDEKHIGIEDVRIEAEILRYCWTKGANPVARLFKEESLGLMA